MIHPEFLALSYFEMAVVIIIIISAYSIKGIAGFGAGFVAIPLLAFFLPLTLIVPLLGLLAYSGSVLQSFSLRKQVAWRELLPIIPFSILGIVMAIWFLVNIDGRILLFVLGIFVISYSVYSLISPSVAPGSQKWSILSGTFGGMFGAMFGSGSPCFVLYLKMRQVNKAQLRATMAMILFLDGGTRIVGYAVSGFYSEQILWMALIFWPLLLLGLFIGHKLHDKVNEQKFNRGVNILLIGSGFMLMVKAYGMA